MVHLSWFNSLVVGATYILEFKSTSEGIEVLDSLYFVVDWNY